jgi:transcription-repair coupling factor (superfamily II helicase)
MIQRLVPDARVAVGHGQLEGDRLEEIMMGFVDGRYDVLVATTIVESGLDITNANTILINDAQNFGLSDIHQMRGRVGRSNKKAFCYLIVPSLLILTNDAKRRLKAITEFNELGSGFQIAMRDLDIRGAGNLMGAEQSGFIHEMGFDTYMKILNEALEELKEEDWYKENMKEDNLQIDKSAFGRSFVKETQMETDLEMLIPDSYVRNNQERLKLYSELDEIDSEFGLLHFEQNLKDRFGPLPWPVLSLVKAFKVRLLAKSLGFEKIILKGGKLQAWFLSKPKSPYYSSSIFMAVMNYVQKSPTYCTLKENENRLSLTIKEVKSMEDAEGIFGYIRESIPSELQSANA